MPPRMRVATRTCVGVGSTAPRAPADPRQSRHRGVRIHTREQVSTAAAAQSQAPATHEKLALASIACSALRSARAAPLVRSGTTPRIV